jgi:hypothetical protein
VIHPPLLFCEGELIPIIRPDPFSQTLPIPTTKGAGVIFYVTFLLPIGAAAFHLIGMAGRTTR